MRAGGPAARSEPGPLHRRFPTLVETLPRVPLSPGPSPVRRLDRLGAALGGASIWVKDDGRYGSTYGGNKARKLEYLLGEAWQKGRRTIVTFGATGTHHGLATALYAGALGIETVLLAVDQPSGDRTAQLSRLRAAGAHVHSTRSVLRAALLGPFVWLRHFRGFRPPYLVPPGGSSPIGTVGVVEGALELGEQVAAGELPAPAHVVVALGSGGTAAGLLLGLRLAGLSAPVVAVRVSDIFAPGRRRIARLARRTARLLRARGADIPPLSFGPFDLVVRAEWLGDGYARPTEAGRRAAELVRATEGIQTEDVYTAKTMAALIDLVRAKELAGGPVLYWHTFDALSGTDPDAAAGPAREVEGP